MKVPLPIRILILSLSCTLLFSFSANKEKLNYTFPWKSSGLTERQAAAHLLSRFTFGPRPGEVDKIVEMGLEKWFAQQLQGNLSDNEVQTRLKDYNALNLSNEQVLTTYPRNARILKMAMDDGVISKDSIDKEDKQKYKTLLEPYMEKKGFKPLRELQRQFVNQKIIRAAYSNNQLTQILADFWFNHFNVSVTKNDCAQFIPAYERDAIRPNVLGKFEDLLMATAKSPAMLFYLDNFSSSGINSELSMQNQEKFQRKLAARLGKDSSEMLKKLKGNKKNQGLNENYAREVMELHTLGVDGGYTQQDVTQAARILTGWTVYPIAEYGPGSNMRKIVDKIGEDKLSEKGFVHEGDFLFTANRHDNGEKTVLGKTFKSNGYQEGVELLKMLAHHAATAQFISHKMAVRFVSDKPPKSLTDKMAKTFIASNGDIKEVLITIVSSPEFWSGEALRQKTKSPFELAMSAVRSLNADIERPYGLYKAIEKMGQKLFAYQAPTGFPDRGQYWINTGALLNRMNFGLAIASQKIPGIRIDLLALNNNHEPESTEAALNIYSKILLPERNVDETVKRLKPLLNDPELEKKVNQAAEKNPNASSAMNDNMMQADIDITGDEAQPKAKKATTPTALNDQIPSKNLLSQVAGIIIGSPEFQRR